MSRIFQCFFLLLILLLSISQSQESHNLEDRLLNSDHNNDDIMENVIHNDLNEETMEHELEEDDGTYIMDDIHNKVNENNADIDNNDYNEYEEEPYIEYNQPGPDLNNDAIYDTIIDDAENINDVEPTDSIEDTYSDTIDNEDIDNDTEDEGMDHIEELEQPMDTDPDINEAKYGYQEPQSNEYDQEHIHQHSEDAYHEHQHTYYEEDIYDHSKHEHHQHCHDDGQCHDIHDDEYYNEYRDYNPDIDDEEDNEYADPVQPIDDKYGIEDIEQAMYDEEEADKEYSDHVQANEDRYGTMDDAEEEEEGSVLDNIGSFMNNIGGNIGSLFSSLKGKKEDMSGLEPDDYMELYKRCNAKVDKLEARMAASSIVEINMNHRILVTFVFVLIDVIICIVCHPRQSTLYTLIWMSFWSILSGMAYTNNQTSSLFIVLAANAAFPLLTKLSNKN